MENLTEMFEKLDNASEELGPDFGGFSPVDLLLDNFLQLSIAEARAVVEAWEEEQ